MAYTYVNPLVTKLLKLMESIRFTRDLTNGYNNERAAVHNFIIKSERAAGRSFSDSQPDINLTSEESGEF